MAENKEISKTALSIAGSDSSGGAGIQADLKTFTALGVYGATAVTCVVAEHPGRVKSVHPVPVKNIVEQIELVFEAFPVHAVKTGMLYSEEIIKAASRCLARRKRMQLVVDPVMVATSGARLLKKSATRALCDLLLPLATLVTPNLDEAAILAERPLRNVEEMKAAALLCARRWGVSFLIKGGHLKLKQAVDIFSDGQRVVEFSALAIPNVKTHGTGCTYSAAICAYLAQGYSLLEAIGEAKKFVTHAIRGHVKLGKFQLLNHSLS
ncbi:MAG: bifunctional hydroxymethylpyrimidine kinase/phosphomethylpyrimidine kinase [bacterium]